jgi:hypothetical protein
MVVAFAFIFAAPLSFALSGLVPLVVKGLLVMILQSLHLTNIGNAGGMLGGMCKTTSKTSRWLRVRKVCPKPGESPIRPVAMALLEGFEALSNRSTEIIKRVGAAAVNGMKVRKNVSKTLEIFLSMCELHPL